MAVEMKREQPVRLPNPSAQPFTAALKTARFYAVLFFWVTMVCVLAHATTFILAEWAGLYDLPSKRAAAPLAEPIDPKPAAEPAAPAVPVVPTPAVAPPAPAAAPAPAGTSWLALFESTASAAPKPEKAKTEKIPGEPFSNVPFEERTPAKAPKAPKDSAKDSTKELPKPAAKEPVETLKPPATPEAPASTADTEGKIVGQPEARPKEVLPLTPEQKRTRAEYYRMVTTHLLRPTRIIGVLTALLLALTLFVYLQITLLGRLAGIRQLTNSLFLLLVFLATVLPWENIFEGFQVSSLYQFSQLLTEHAARLSGPAPDVWAQAAYYVRFFGMPVLSVVLLAWSGILFSAGYRESVLAND